VSILLGDATAGTLDPDSATIRSFELFCVRSGAQALSLSVRATHDISEVISALRPDAVVLAGRSATDDAVARWAYAIRLAAGPLPITLFRRDVSRSLRSRTTGAQHLPPVPSEAQIQLAELVTAEELAQTKEAATPTRLVPRRNRAG
jgi:hypothetical protein